jgi:hypothetical protein
MLVNPDADLGVYYADDESARSEVASEKAKIKRHYLEPANLAGFTYTSVSLSLDFVSIRIHADTSEVVVTANVEYRSKYPNDAQELTTKEGGMTYELHLARQRGSWVILSNSYVDTFSKRGKSTLPKLHEWLASEPPQPSEDVGILWYQYYNRSGAVSYAEDWWNRQNPVYMPFSADCTNYVSQCFYEGGDAPKAWDSPYVWWYNHNGTFGQYQYNDDTWSTSWSVAHDQAYNLSRNSEQYEMRGTYVSSAGELALGDSIYYDFGGDGILDHAAIVVEIRNGEPYVNYHTSYTWHRHWNLNAVTTRFFKVTDWYWIN